MAKKRGVGEGGDGEERVGGGRKEGSGEEEGTERRRG